VRSRLKHIEACVRTIQKHWRGHLGRQRAAMYQNKHNAFRRRVRPAIALHVVLGELQTSSTYLWR
jgi:hypothetical protein